MRLRAFVGASALLALGGAAMSDPPPAPPVEYKFVENTDRWVSVVRGEWRLIGKLDKNGEFVFRNREGLRDAVSAGSVPDVTLNGAGLAAKKAYEFRSGVLIPGEMRKDGDFVTFVPEAGGKIIAFADYKYTPDGPPIWNLPGRFQPVKPPDAKK